jgi:hypothetical protein
MGLFRGSGGGRRWGGGEGDRGLPPLIQLSRKKGDGTFLHFKHAFFRNCVTRWIETFTCIESCRPKKGFRKVFISSGVPLSDKNIFYISCGSCEPLGKNSLASTGKGSA